MEVVPIIICTIVIPLGIRFHDVTKWKEMKGLTAEDEESFNDVRRASERLEDRLRSMDRILDSEVPDWRSRHDS